MNDGEKAAAEAGPSRRFMIGIYLNDHLAGATAGTQLARRMARYSRPSGVQIPEPPLAGLGVRADRAGASWSTPGWSERSGNFGARQ
jgi:hypothetical protein